MNRRERQVTAAEDALLAVFLADPLRPRYQYELWRDTGVRSRWLDVALARLTARGLLARDRQAAGGTTRRGRRLPPRAFWTLTQAGQADAKRRAQA